MSEYGSSEADPAGGAAAAGWFAEHLAGLVDAANLGVLHYRHRARTLHLSQRLATMLDLGSGVTRASLRELLGRLPRDERATAIELMRTLAEATEPADVTLGYRMRTGEPRLARVTIAPQFDGDGFSGALALVADQTESARRSRSARQQFSVAEAYFHNSPAPTAVFERVRGDEYLVDCNQALERISGGRIRDLVGMPSRVYTSDGTDEFRTGIIDGVRACLDTRQSSERRFSFFDDRYQHRPAVVEVSFSFAPPGRVIVQIHDLSEIMQAYEQASRSERNYRSLAEHAPVGILRCDAAGRVRYANPRLRTLLRQTVALDQPLPGPPPLADGVSRCLATGQPVTLRHRLDSTEGDEGVWLESRLHPELETGETPAGVLGIVADVTQDVLAASAVEKREQQLRSVFDNLADPIVVADEQGLVRIVNDAFCSLSGYERHDIVGSAIDTIVPTDFPGTHHDFIESYRHTGRGRFIGQGPREVALRTRSGDTVPVELAISESRVENEFRFIAAMRDLRERKAAEERQRQLQKMEALGQLTGGIAHDFNNVLSIIKGNVELIGAYLEHESADIEEFLGNLILAIDQGTGLTSQLLAFSRQDAGTSEPVDVGRVVQDAIRLLMPGLGTRIGLETTMPDSTWLTLANRNDLLNVVVNLVLNARDAIDGAGTIRLTVTNEPGAAQPDAVRLTVRDTGRGIPEHLLEQVCEPFFTTKPDGRGTGLGLSMARSFAEGNGGTLSIESTVDAGTTVSVVLPRLRRPRVEPGPGNRRDDPRIVVVEGDQTLAAFIARTINEDTHMPCVAHEAQRALTELTGHASVSALITNVLLPHGVKGLDVALAARKLHPEIDCVFIADRGDGELASEARRYGPVLSLPISELDILGSLRPSPDDGR